MQIAIKVIATYALLTGTSAAFAMQNGCSVTTGATLTPVIELYTSEGCSSCPPADKWLSTLKGKPVVAQAFHVGYCDYIGWVDRFAAPAHTTRQRQIASANGLANIYTPQLVRNGKDWRDYERAASVNETARATIDLKLTSPDRFEATVMPAPGVQAWAAYWTVTEHGHSSRVRAGENNGETLQHDFVVRQYAPVGSYRGAQNLSFNTAARDPAHPRQVNLVVFDPATLKPLQAISASCG